MKEKSSEMGKIDNVWCVVIGLVYNRDETEEKKKR